MEMIGIALAVGLPIVALCIFLIRNDKRKQNLNDGAETKTLWEKLRYIKYPTFDVVLLCICTGGFYYFYTAYTLGRTLQEKSTNAKLLPAFALIAAALAYYINYILLNLNGMIVQHISNITEDTYFSIIGIAALVSLVGNTALWIFLLCFSFMSRKFIQEILQENDVFVPLNGFLCFLFPVFYQQYVLHNAEARYTKAVARVENSQAQAPVTHEPPQEDKLAKLEKLAQLKESGILSDEEFQEEKKKLLS